jgi:UDP-N-acetylglucosamine 2-epimerase (non-hydrolysing)
MIVVGARPNFMKAAPILTAIRKHNELPSGRSPLGTGVNASRFIEPILVHTGQHYDEAMSDSFFTDLNLPKPDVHLGVGSASHAVQTAEIMRRFEEVVLREKPDAVLVVGDVNSTLACALVVSKIAFDSAGTRPMVAHVEAGLRSFDRTMPEECNRVLTDHLSDLLFVTEPSGLRNLRREGIDPEKVHFVGNTMIDSLLAYRDKAESSGILDQLRLRQKAPDNRSRIAPYAVLTLHRPASVDTQAAFRNVLQGLEELGSELPIIFPAHPRTQKRVEEFGLERYFNSILGRAARGNEAPVRKTINLLPPLGYLDFLCLMKHARLVVTDSGGIQEETTCLGIPCVTVRDNTERPITVKRGTNIIAGVTPERIRASIRQQLRGKKRVTFPPKWDGKTASRIVKVLAETIGRCPSNAPGCNRMRARARPVPGTGREAS